MIETRTLGWMKIPVTRLGLGLAALGRPGYINLGHADDLDRDYDVEAMRNHTHDVLDAAWELGVRYFDAARSYGRAEAFLSSWLAKRQLSPDDVTVGSKWGYTYTAGWQIEADKHEVKEHSLAVLQRQIGETNALLADHLDLYQIHSATLESGVLTNSAVLAELARLRETGLGIGLSLSGPAQAKTLQKAMEIEVDSKPLFTAVQLTFNLLETSVGATAAEAHARGIGVIVKEAVANGRLTPRNDTPAFAPKMAQLQALADEQATSVDAIALAFVLAQPWVDVVLSGAAQVDHLRSNAEALTVSISAEAWPNLAEPAEQYWQTRSNLDWN